MARPNFTVSIPGERKQYRLPNLSTPVATLRPTARYASEGQAGSSKRRLPEGWKDPTGYTFIREAYSSARGRGYVTRKDNGYEDHYYGVMIPTVPFQQATAVIPSTLASTWTTQQDQALIKARLAMKRTDINLGVAFAERNKTAQLVGDTAMTLAKAMVQLRQKNFAGAARTLGLRKKKPSRAGLDITSKWLELQYGWKPLLSDVYGATEALAKRNRSDWRVTGKGTQFAKIEGSIKESSNPNGWDSGFGEYHGRRGVYVRIDALPQNDLLIVLSQLGITNPLLVGWELVPYSFVVDWFLPIGSFLDSLDAMLGYGPTACSITQWQKIEVDIRRFGKWESSTHKYDIDWRGFHYENIFLKRSASSSVPLPTLPRFKDPRSLGHMANGLSLLATAFASGPNSKLR